MHTPRGAVAPALRTAAAVTAAGGKGTVRSERRQLPGI